MDRDLIGGAQQGDREAFVSLIHGRVDRLFAIAYRILRDVDRAEDALQEALVLAWRDLRGLRDPDRLDAWLHRLVVRACIAHAKREKRYEANLFGRIQPDSTIAADDMARVADRDQLARGFDRLVPEQRAILVLRHFLGYSSAEIADTLGIPSGTARSRLFNAHRAMRAALEADARHAVVGGRSTC